MRSRLLGLLARRLFLRLLLAKDSVPIVRPLLVVNGAGRVSLSRAVSAIVHAKLLYKNRNGRGITPAAI